MIESKVKPSQPWGKIAQTAFRAKSPAKEANPPAKEQGHISQTILAIGHQDTDPCGLVPPLGIEIAGAISDHLIVDSGIDCLPVGAEIKFQLNYSALIRVMTSPFVAKVVTIQSHSIPVPAHHVKH